MIFQKKIPTSTFFIVFPQKIRKISTVLSIRIGLCPLLTIESLSTKIVVTVFDKIVNQYRESTHKEQRKCVSQHASFL